MAVAVDLLTRFVFPYLSTNNLEALACVDNAMKSVIAPVLEQKARANVSPSSRIYYDFGRYLNPMDLQTTTNFLRRIFICNVAKTGQSLEAILNRYGKSVHDIQHDRWVVTTLLRLCCAYGSSMDTFVWFYNEMDVKRSDFEHELNLMHLLVSARTKEKVLWLMSKLGITAKQVRNGSSKAFLPETISKGWLDIDTAKWYCSPEDDGGLGFTLDDFLTYNISSSSTPLEYVCYHGNLDVVSWLFSHLHVERQHVVQHKLLKKACVRYTEHRKFSVPMWLCRKYKLTASRDIGLEAFEEACHRGHLPCTKWLYTTFKLTPADIQRRIRFVSCVSLASYARPVFCIMTIEWLLKMVPFSDNSLSLAIRLILQCHGTTHHHTRLMLRWVFQRFTIPAEYVYGSHMLAHLCRTNMNDIAEFIIQRYNLSFDAVSVNNFAALKFAATTHKVEMLQLLEKHYNLSAEHFRACNAVEKIVTTPAFKDNIDVLSYLHTTYGYPTKDDVATINRCIIEYNPNLRKWLDNVCS